MECECCGSLVESGVCECRTSRQRARAEITMYKGLMSDLSKVRTTPWYILVRYAEPSLDLTIRTERFWYGQFDERFIEWLTRHWDFWQDKADVSVGLEEIHKYKKKEERDW